MLAAVFDQGLLVYIFILFCYTSQMKTKKRKENSQIDVEKKKKNILRRVKTPLKMKKKTIKKLFYIFMYVRLVFMSDTDVCWLCNSKHVIKNRQAYLC